MRRVWYRWRHGWFSKIAGDKAYSSKAIRRWITLRGSRPVIPETSQQAAMRSGPAPPFDRRAYRKRNVVERAVGWLKERRRIGTRSEKLAMNFGTMITIGVVERYMRTLLPNTP